MLDNPIAKAHARGILKRLEIRDGMRVVDVGCGVGRLTLPIAALVGTRGEVVALDLQERMLAKLARRAARRGLENVHPVRAGAGNGALEGRSFDLALLLAVLGEIPEHRRAAALKEIFEALVPGGLLAVAEGPPDPHRQSREAVLELSERTGFRLHREDPLWGGFLMQLRRPEVTAPAP